jgi:NAD(P)-dependent dehydrogenase (short-subunit alcohol dehydrogenase family)
MRPLAEQTVLITGSTDGLGRALAIELGSRGSRLLLHGRDSNRLEETVAEIRGRTANTNVVTYIADFAALDDVREMGLQVAQEAHRIDALVNNAGIGMTLPGDGVRMESQDGYELRFAVNYLAHFLLTRSILPVIVSSAPSRIVNVTSAGQAPIDFDDVMLERSYSGTQAYGQSKLAQIMLTFDLAEELRGDGATANALHPSTFMPTKIVLAAGFQPSSSLEQGVAATLRLVADSDLEDVTGRYFNREREARADPQAYDPDARRPLRELSERLVEPVLARGQQR